MEELEDSRQGKRNCECETHPLPRRGSVHITRKTSSGNAIPGPSAQEKFNDLIDVFEPIDLNSESGGSMMTNVEGAWNNLTALGLSFGSEASVIKSLPSSTPRFSMDDISRANGPHLRGPFDKFLQTLHKKATLRQKRASEEVEGDSLGHDDSGTVSPLTQFQSGHKRSSSTSSMGFVTAVKSASISLASFSIAPRSRRTAVSSRHQDRSSRASNPGVRRSEDSSYFAGGSANDEGVIKRSVQRRRILEELISTEESYLGDIKFLMNIYVTLFASMPTLSLSMRSSIRNNLNEIADLHESILGDLHKVVPHSEYTQTDFLRVQHPQNGQGHHRWRSLDAVPENIGDMDWSQRASELEADASIAAEVAELFGQKLHRFFVYEEYGAKYELMVKDVTTAYHTISQWEVYQKGLEALGKSLASHNSQHDNLKKSLTVGDLMVKPIQRVCRYPLLFAELLKQTPVCDCPDSHMEIEKVLLRLRETTTEINRATNDPRIKVTMEKTWLLQDRLAFSDQTEAHSKNALRALGHIQLCGVLHVAWQTRDGVDGRHMISLLYRDFLVLAIADKGDQTYIIQACIGLGEVRVEEADNGRGLQCHTTPYSWKLVFEFDHQLYEIILSACTPKEELEWRTRLNDRVYKDHIDVSEITFFTSLSLSIRTLGTVFGKPGTVARRVSIHRATTVGPKSALCQVIIKNTSALKDISRSASSTSINRSQSLLSTNRIPVLAPARSDRVRLENGLSDVWSRDILPFPGMTGRARGEHLVRASASSMIRKLSVASITSNFTKRSASQPSLNSLHQPLEENLDLTDTRSLCKGGYENIVREIRETSSASGSEHASQSRLSIIQDENNLTIETTPGNNVVIGECPVDIMCYRPGLQVRKSWQLDRAGTITPPLRTSSANSVPAGRTPPVVSVTFNTSEKENQGPKPSRWPKATSLNKGLSAEGLRNLFR